MGYISFRKLKENWISCSPTKGDNMVLTKVALIVTLAALLLPLEATQTPAPTPAPKPMSEQQFIAQIDKSNVAMDKFLRLPCDDKGIPDAAQDLLTQINNLKEAYKNISNTGQDTLVQTRETELYIGFIELADSYIPEKRQGCAPADKPDSDPSPPIIPDDSTKT